MTRIPVSIKCSGCGATGVPVFPGWICSSCSGPVVAIGFSEHAESADALGLAYQRFVEGRTGAPDPWYASSLRNFCESFPAGTVSVRLVEPGPPAREADALRAVEAALASRPPSPASEELAKHIREHIPDNVVFDILVSRDGVISLLQAVQANDDFKCALAIVVLETCSRLGRWGADGCGFATELVDSCSSVEPGAREAVEWLVTRIARGMAGKNSS